jgi:SAM-dependent methyltransferase
LVGAEVERALDDAWEWVNAQFPFPGYIRAARKPSYVGLPRTAARWVRRPGTILDFGAGPCDKTAMFARLGFTVTAYDDLLDPWHLLGDNRQRILDFAAAAGIAYRLPEKGSAPVPFARESFDMVMLHHVLEHLHDSPRQLLTQLVDCVRPGGVLYVSVPNAANIRKRLFLLLGRTNYPPYDTYYWYPGPWRGHVREYVRNDLVLLARFLGLEVLELKSYNHFWHAVPAALRPVFKVVGAVCPGFRDSWLLVARKPAGWVPRTALAPRELASALRRTEFYDYGSSVPPKTHE